MWTEPGPQPRWSARHLSSWGSPDIRRVGRDGVITTAFSGLAPASSFMAGLAFGRLGDLYVFDIVAARIPRIGPRWLRRGHGNDRLQWR